MTDIIGTFLSIFFIVGVFIIGPSIIYKNNLKKRRGGILTFQDRIYPYFIGNNLTYRRHGIVVELPKQLPAIYLDTLSSKTEKQATIDAFMNATMFSLEGEFSDKYQVFCVNGNERNVLRVLTPDFMSILLDFVNNYDIEICGNKIWILSDDKVVKNIALQQEILTYAARLIEKLDKVTRTNSFNEQATVEFDFRYVRTLRIFGSYIPKNIFYLSLFCFFLTAVIWISAFYVYLETQRTLYIALLLSLIIFPVIPYVMRRVQKNESNKVILLMDKRSQQKRAVALAAKQFVQSLFNK